MTENVQNIQVQHLPHFSSQDAGVDILRLDQLHPVISGNKWFKLQYYLQDALANKKNTIATFGGAFSNHIVATAYAAKRAGLKSIGYIRGEKTIPASATLLQAENYGMELVYVERNAYHNKEEIIQNHTHPQCYWIREGGYGELGSKGAAGILQVTNTSPYSYILCAVGTGTMMSGLIRSSLPAQKIIGISVLKNNFDLEKQVLSLLEDEENRKPFSILHDYHFGGYAKYPPDLISFMQETWLAEKLPTDIVYTSKLLFATKDLVSHNYFPSRARILLIHSGGLQGNTSLPPGTLPFS
jgi:1-aminocyclopropane-1-carboxylate deaminase